MSRVQESIQKIERQLILDRQSLAHMERTRPNRLKVRFGWGTWIRTRINGVRSLATSSCLPRLKPGTVLLREYQGERPTVTVVPTGYLWPETAYASLPSLVRQY